VAQLSHLTGLCPQIAVGSPTFFSARGDLAASSPPTGVQFILRTLRESPRPVSISIVGSARDMAEVIAREPQLFKDKCARIYLCAGSGSPDPAKVPSLEWNVALDPAGYAQIFRAPCPLYWLPCLEDEDRHATDDPREYASHFRFRQAEVLPSLSQELRSFFGMMYQKRDSSFWLHALRENFDDVLSVQNAKFRMMYSTPLFFDVAGLCVTTGGKILRKSESRNDWVYRFEPVQVDCGDDGVTRWKPVEESNRFIFRVLNIQAYSAAMTRAMNALLVEAFGHAG